MSAGDHLQVVCMVELLSYVLAEGVACSSRVHSPSCTVIWVRPKQIAHRTFMRDFLEPLKGSDIVKSLDAGRKSTVKTEKLIFDNCSEGQKVE